MQAEKAQSTQLVHPGAIILVLLLAGLTTLFLSIAAAYLYARVESDAPQTVVPWIFYFNVFVLLASSYFMNQARKAFADWKKNLFKQSIYFSLGLTVLFTALQVIGWIQLFQQEAFITSNVSNAYLYALSGLHLAHVVGGLPFLVAYLVKFIRQVSRSGDLDFFTHEKNAYRLKYLSWYWHFVDILWIFLVLFLFANSVI